MTDWTERSAAPTSIWRRVRAFFFKNAAGFFSVRGDRKDRYSFKKASNNFYSLALHDGSSVIKKGTDNFYRVFEQ